jgi:hypothetical protein
LDRVVKEKELFELAIKKKYDTSKIVYNFALDDEKFGFIEITKAFFKDAAQMKSQTPEEEI